MSRQTLVVPVEWKAADDEDNVMEGYASTFGNVDLQFDVVAKGAFKNTIGRVKKGEVPFLADHMASVRNVLGTLVDAQEDSKGLRIKVRFSEDADAQAIRQKMLGKHVNRMSIGYEPMQWRYETRGEQRVRVLEDVRLWEVSAVVFPANPEAVVQTVKSAVRDTIDTVVAGAVASGGDEREIKAALAEWMSGTVKGGAPGVVEPPASPERKQGSTDTTHLDTEDAGQPEGAEPGKGERGPDSLTLKMRRADAVLAGRDPDEIADPVQLAGVTTRLDLLADWVKQATREAEPADGRDVFRGNR